MVGIGTVIAGVEIYGICQGYCIARNVSPSNANIWIVCNIGEDGDSLQFKRYFSNQMDAEWEFASLAFPWF